MLFCVFSRRNKQLPAHLNASDLGLECGPSRSYLRCASPSSRETSSSGRPLRLPSTCKWEWLGKKLVSQSKVKVESGETYGGSHNASDLCVFFVSIDVIPTTFLPPEGCPDSFPSHSLHVLLYISPRSSKEV